MALISQSFAGENGELELSISVTGGEEEMVIVEIDGKSVSMSFSELKDAVEFMGKASKLVSSIY